MPIVTICDADGETILTEATAVRFPWGYDRVYSEKAAKDVEEYFHDLQTAAATSRAVFEKLQVEAVAKFKQKYPTGKLPDEKDSDSVVIDNVSDNSLLMAESDGE